VVRLPSIGFSYVSCCFRASCALTCSPAPQHSGYPLGHPCTRKFRSLHAAYCVIACCFDAHVFTCSSCTCVPPAAATVLARSQHCCPALDNQPTPTPACFVSSPQSAPPLPSTFVFTVRALDSRCLPIHFASYAYSIPAPPRCPPPAACRLIPHPTRSLCIVLALDLHHPRTRSHTCSPHTFYALPRACPLFCTLLGPGRLCIFPAYCTLSSAVFDVVFFYFSSYCMPLSSIPCG
jgi:hypothetical protein